MKLAILGGSGAAGGELLRRALDSGHEVRALVRASSRLEPREYLTVVVGDVRDATAVTELVRGVDAVVSLIGPSEGDRTVCSAATEHVLAAMRTHGIRRYVLVSGAAVNVSGDRKTFLDRVFDRLVRRIERGGVEDRERELQLLQQTSDIEWTVLRVPRLTDKPATGYATTSLDRPRAKQLGRADLAIHLLAQVVATSAMRKAPFLG